MVLFPYFISLLRDFKSHWQSVVPDVKLPWVLQQCESKQKAVRTLWRIISHQSWNGISQQQNFFWCIVIGWTFQSAHNDFLDLSELRWVIDSVGNLKGILTATLERERERLYYVGSILPNAVIDPIHPSTFMSVFVVWHFLKFIKELLLNQAMPQKRSP